VTLDVWLVARLCAELREAVVGARITAVDAGAGGMRLGCYRRGASSALRATFDPDGPLLALHRETAPVNENVAGGWSGGVAPLLRGCTIESVQAVPNDRVVFLDLVSRSPFGVPARHRVAFELEPNKANILVLRPADGGAWQILAAAKQVRGTSRPWSTASEARRPVARTIVVGEAYELPPPRRARLDADAFIDAVTDLDRSQPRALVRALGEFDPTCSPPLAREIVERVLSDGGAGMPHRMLALWAELKPAVAAACDDIRAPVFAWPSPDGFSLAHVVPLTWPPGTVERRPSLNDVCAQQQEAAERKRGAPGAGALRKRLRTMLERGESEIASLESARRKAGEADALRVAGEAIYTYLSAIPARAETFVTPDGVRIVLDPTIGAKENAAAYFRRFKKARSGLPRIEHRLSVLRADREYWEGLLWELDRALSAPDAETAAIVGEIAGAIGARSGAAKPRARRASAPRTASIPGGATAYVGRSPKDNERVTFSLGSPDDWWFHARGIPGAHVILKLADPRSLPSDEQILAAAALAAGQSRAADAQAVEVDYTQRKHVRKQGGGRVGLVWYTDFSTVRVPPRRM
jgi:predicted ribosome quality control (RQC) complex YloA/Tae2 family protein